MYEDYTRTGFTVTVWDGDPGSSKSRQLELLASACNHGIAIGAFEAAKEHRKRGWLVLSHKARIIRTAVLDAASGR